MIKKHTITFGIAMAMALLLISTAFYPGGSQHDATSVGFVWQHNYLSNLLNPIAVNGQDNTARPWVIAGMLFLCVTVAVFFVRFSKKLPSKHAANVVLYAGIGSQAITLLTATPLHDIAVTISGTLLLLCLFYCTVFIFKSRMQWMKVLSVVCLLAFYGSWFIYYARIHLEILPIMQKVSLVVTLLWILALEYLAKKEDFQPPAAVLK